MAVCWEFATPMGSFPDLGWGVTANFKLVFCNDWKNNLKNYRVQAKSFDIGDWTFRLEFKSRRRPKTPRSDAE